MSFRTYCIYKAITYYMTFNVRHHQLVQSNIFIHHLLTFKYNTSLFKTLNTSLNVVNVKLKKTRYHRRRPRIYNRPRDLKLIFNLLFFAPQNALQLHFHCLFHHHYPTIPPSDEGIYHYLI